MPTATGIMAKHLRNGDLVQWRHTIGIVRLEFDGKRLAPTGILVRRTECRIGYFGLMKRWLRWEELSTPIIKLDPNETLKTYYWG
ncbi:MAG: hypothetical protein NTZ05_07210 [Chloroflexi bacterium]|nr:hypothetical protein [Chloroflexota bacterium]